MRRWEGVPHPWRAVTPLPAPVPPPSGRVAGKTYFVQSPGAFVLDQVWGPVCRAGKMGPFSLD
jgi:hypothetical protein